MVYAPYIGSYASTTIGNVQMMHILKTLVDYINTGDPRLSQLVSNCVYSGDIQLAYTIVYLTYPIQTLIPDWHHYAGYVYDRADMLGYFQKQALLKLPQEQRIYSHHTNSFSAYLDEENTVHVVVRPKPPY